MRFPLVPLMILALPLIEIVGFILVGQRIGVLPTLALILLSSAAGGLLLRIQGFSTFRRLNEALSRGETPGPALVDGFMILLAGMLLIVPGFFSDLVGILLFIPPLRRFIWKRAARRMSGGVTFTRFSMDGRQFRRNGGSVVDLDPEEYRRPPRARDPGAGRIGKEPDPDL